MIGWFFVLGGVAVGVVQALLLARAAAGSAVAAPMIVRLLLVGAVLVLAARSGQLVPGTAGWVSGFAVSCALLYFRRPR